MPQAPSPIAPVLSARNLAAGYVPGIEILHGVSVDAFPNEIRCVLGPNGTGKSTLLKVLYGFLKPTNGEIRRGAEVLTGVPPHAMGRHGIAYLPQRPSVFPFLSVEVNLRLGAWSFRRRQAEVKRKTELAYTQFPILYEKRHQTAGTLSGGQQRQLEFARSLFTEPSVFLIDEPTASIEPRISTQIYDLIRGLAREGKAVLLVDQNIKGALGIADYVYVMRTGTLYTEGRRAEFGDDVELLVSQWLYTHHAPARGA
jgi:branched-chain amino acid transport system ATP-binding protein